MSMTTYGVSERDGFVEVCAEINDLPSGGLDCDVVVRIASLDGEKAGTKQVNFV